MTVHGPLRSFLFAPAVRPEIIDKLARSEADAVVIDCEDSAPPAAKSNARSVARSRAPQLVAARRNVMVRVNAVATDWFVDDVSDGLVPGLAAVVLPKIERIESLDSALDTLDAHGFTTLAVFLGIETALGVADARILLAQPRVVGAYFGAEDFIVDMGGVRTPSNREVAFARSAVAIAGRLAGVPVLDQVVTEFHNDRRFLEEAQEARAMGYSGKLCIHPVQVSLANEAFTPSLHEVRRAQLLLDAFDRAKRVGKGAIEFDGQMVDEPLARQARNVILRWSHGVNPGGAPNPASSSHDR